MITLHKTKLFSRVRNLFLLLPLAAFCDEEIDERDFPISKVIFEYSREHPDLISAEKFEKFEVSLGEDQVISIQELNQKGEEYRFTEGMIQKVLDQVRGCYKEKGIDYVHVSIPPTQISPEGNDRRKGADLVVVIDTPVIAKVEATATVEGDPKGRPLPPKQEKRILGNLPSKLPDPATGYPGDLVNSTTLNNYLYSLNRHPGRQVDLEIGPADTPGSVALNFVVHQERPYYFYTSISSNIPVVVSRWIESFGYINTQLTGRDDILRVDYSTDSFDCLHTFLINYEAPVFNSLDQRWKIGANVNRFTSAQFGIGANPFKGTQYIVDGEYVITAYQYWRLFLDLFFHLEYRHINNNKHFIYPSVSKNFLLPSGGLRLTRLTTETKLIASAGINTLLSDVFWNVGHHLDSLGRPNLSHNWAYLDFDFYGSFYLEETIKKAYRKEHPVTHLANEIVFHAQSQYAFHKRLIPQLEGVLGGLYTVRGYPQSTAAGDSIYAGSLEYRLHVPRLYPIRQNGTKYFFGKPLKWAPSKPKDSLDWDFIIKAFFDIGKIVINKKVLGEQNETLAGTGLGAELILWHNVFIRADWGIALTTANGVKHGNHEVYFTSVIIF